MSLAIVTKYLGPTNYRQSRISVRVGNHRPVAVPWNYDLSDDENNYENAARTVAKRKGFTVATMHRANTKTGAIFVATVA